MHYVGRFWKIKTLSSLHVYIFLCDFSWHYIVSEYNVCLEEYMNLSPGLINGTKSKDTKPMRRRKRSESQKN